MVVKLEKIPVGLKLFVITIDLNLQGEEEA